MNETGVNERIKEIEGHLARLVEGLEKISTTNGLKSADIFRICEETLFGPIKTNEKNK